MTAVGRASEWRKVSLGCVGVWRGGGTPSKATPDFWRNGTVPWVSAKDMKTKLISDSQDHITEAAVVASAARRIPAGSVVFVTRSGILRSTLPIALTCAEVTVNQDLKTLTPDTDYDPKYVLWACLADSETIRRTCHKAGTTVESIDFEALKRFEIRVPRTMGEQKRVVARIEELMSDVDAGESEIGKAKARLARFRSEVLAAAFDPSSLQCSPEWNDEVGAVGTTRAYRSCPFVRLEKLFKWASGDGLTEKARKGGAIPVYGGNGISGWHDVPMVREAAIVVGRVGFYCGNIHVTSGEAWITDNCIRSTWHDPRANLQFFAYWLEGQKLNRRSAGTRQKYINQSVLKNLVAPFPGEDVQLRVVAEIEESLSLVEHTGTLLEQTLRRAAAVRQSILKSAFSGQLI